LIGVTKLLYTNQRTRQQIIDRLNHIFPLYLVQNTCLMLKQI